MEDRGSFKDEWCDSTPVTQVLEDLLISLRQFEALSEDDFDLIASWNEILRVNLYETLEHMKDIDAKEWAAMKLPMRLRSMGRKIIWESDSPTNNLSNSSIALPLVGNKKKLTKKQKSNQNSPIDSQRKRGGSLKDSKNKKAKNEELKLSHEEQSPSKTSTTEKLTGFTPKVFRLKSEEKDKDKEDKDKDDRRKKFSRSHPKFKSLRDLTRMTNDIKKEENRLFGMVVVNGISANVIEILEIIKETNVTSETSEKNSTVSFFIKF